MNRTDADPRSRIADKRLEFLSISFEFINNTKLAILGHYFFEVNKRTNASYQNPDRSFIQLI